MSPSSLPRTVARNSCGQASRAVSAFALALLIPGVAQAQDNDGDYWLDRNDRIVVTATRTPVSEIKAPATITLKTDVDIANELVTDIKDLVRFEPGVSVPRQPARFSAALAATGRGGNEGFTIRGIGGNRVLIQVDGVRVPDGFSFGPQVAGRGDYVDVGLVKSVEILRGPASALYGSDGLAGAVSFVTSDPADILGKNRRIGGLLRAGFNGDDQEFSETAIVAARATAISGMIAYTRRDYQELENQGSLGTAGGLGSSRTRANPQDGRSNALLGRLVFEPAGGHKFRLTGEYLDTRLYTDVLSGRSPTVDSLTANDTGERKRLSADWSWSGDGAFETVRAGIYWQDALDSQFTDEMRTPLPDRTRLNTFENRVYGAAVDGRARFQTAGLRHTLVFGGDVSFTRQRGLRSGTVPPAGETYPTRAFPTTDFTWGGVFIGDEISISDGKLVLYPALRWDRYVLEPQKDSLLPPAFAGARQDGSRLSPKFGAVFKFDDTLGCFANYARGFKAPAPSQVNQFFENLTSPFFAYRTLANPNLRPETSESYEGGLRLSTNLVSGSITAFKANYRNFISQEQVGGVGTIANPILFQYVNIGQVNVDGLEAKLDLTHASGFNARFAMAYARGKTSTTRGARGRLSSIDPLHAVIGLGYREPQENRFGAQAILTYHGQQGLAQSAGVCSGPCFRPDEVFLLDLTAQWRITDVLTLRAGLFNLFDKKYALWSDVRGLADTSTAKDAFTRPGRNASASVSFRF